MWAAIYKALLYIINPLNWSVIGAFFSAIFGIFKTIGDTIRKRKQQSDIDKLNEANNDAKKSTTLDEKAEAACRAEKVFNPNSDCDGGTGK
jgi:hypothetical protein